MEFARNEGDLNYEGSLYFNYNFNFNVNLLKTKKLPRATKFYKIDV